MSSNSNNNSGSSYGYHYSAYHSAHHGQSEAAYQGSASGLPSGYTPASATSGVPSHGQYSAANVAQYSTLANYDGSYSRRRSSLPPPLHGSHLPPYALAQGNGVPVVPSNVPPSRYSSQSASGASSSKVFVCEVCGQSFTRAHDRKRHAQIHTRNPDEAPGCQWCNKKFSRGDALKRHLDHGCEGMPDEVFDQCPLAPRD